MGIFSNEAKVQEALTALMHGECEVDAVARDCGEGVAPDDPKARWIDRDGSPIIGDLTKWLIERRGIQARDAQEILNNVWLALGEKKKERQTGDDWTDR